MNAGQKLRNARESVKQSRQQVRDLLRDEFGPMVPSVDTIRRWEQSEDGAEWDPIIVRAMAAIYGIESLRDLSDIAADRLDRYRDLLGQWQPCTTTQAA